MKIFRILIVFFLIGTFFVPSSEAFLSFLKKDTVEQEQPQCELDVQSEMAVDEYNRQAVELFENGHFDEAQKLWEKALEILEKSKGYEKEYEELKASIDDTDTELILTTDSGKEIDRNDIERLYDTAVALFRKEQYVASKKVFERIENLIPDYKAARNYLTILEHKIRQAQQNLSGQSFERNAIARREERAEWDRVLEESRMELENKLAEQVEPVYQEALELYMARNFKMAKDHFNEVNSILPDYKDTEKYLFRIDRDIRKEEELLMEEKRRRAILARKKEKEEWKRIMEESEQELKKKMIELVDPIYEEALLQYKKREFEVAKSRFEEVETLHPGYKSTEDYLSRIEKDIVKEERLRQERRAQELKRQKEEEELARKREEERYREEQEALERERLSRFKEEVAARQREREEWLKVLETSKKERQRKLEEQAQFIYEEAVGYYKGRKFEQAKQDFLEVRGILPDYKSTEKYLARIDDDIEQERKARYEERQREFRRLMREKKTLEQQKWEEEQEQRELGEQRRQEEFHQKVAAREEQRKEWKRILEENELERQKRLEEEAEYIYKEALRAYNKKQWEQARSDFLDVQNIVPGYKDTAKYLAGMDDDILKDQEALRRIAGNEVLERERREAEARREEEERLAGRRKEEENLERQRKEVQAEAVYKFAESLYKREDYEQAKEKFLEVAEILPDYGRTQKYLKRLDKDIDRAEKMRLAEERLAFERKVREQRIARQQEEERLAQTRSAEEEQSLAKLRQEALLREQERRGWEETIRKIEEEHQKRLEEQAEAVYDEALRYYKAGWFEQARETLEEVDAMWPGYKSTEKYLARIDREIRDERRLRQESEDEILGRQERLARRTGEERQREAKQGEGYERPLELDKGALARAMDKEDLKEEMERVERDRRKELRKRAGEIYEKAVKAYKARTFDEAQRLFIEVEKTWPGYKSASEYLVRLDDDIRQEQLAMKETAKDHEAGAEDALPESALEEDGSAHAKTAAQERQKALSLDAETKYRDAVALYKAKDFIQAKLKFIEVESLSPGYKATLKYLSRIDRDIKKNPALHDGRKPEEDRQKLAEGNDGTRPLENGQRRDFIQQALLDVERSLQPPVGERPQRPQMPEVLTQPVLRKEEKVREQPNVDWEKRIEWRRNELKKQRREFQKEYERQFKDLYARAVQLYKEGSYEEARALFQQIEQMRPGYKKASRYLRKAQAKIQNGLQKKKSDFVYQPSGGRTRSNAVEKALDGFEAY